MKYITFIFPFLLIITSCVDRLIDDHFDNTPENNFNIFWKEFDRHYSYFDYKNINWDSIYAAYQPRITEQTSDTELFNMFSEIITNLKDGHVELFSPLDTVSYDFLSKRHAPTPNCLSDNATNNYLVGRTSINNTLYYGKIKNKDIGYINIRTFGGEIADYKHIDTILSEFTTTKGIIIDVRMNGGGISTAAPIIASRFADKNRVYGKTRVRNGPDHNDFTRWTDRLISPAAKTYLNPVIVLMNASCFSTAEEFILMMQLFPNVTTMGDTTGGAVGNPIFRELPNGWVFWLSSWQEVDTDMRQIEGNGIYPDIPLWLTVDEYNNNIDKILETAIDRINNE